jgi:hypothetical protein
MGGKNAFLLHGDDKVEVEADQRLRISIDALAA